MVIAWLTVAACGRVGFDPAARAPDDAIPGESSVDAGLCDYLPTCMTGQITCCAATGSFCTLEGVGTCTGTIARCSIFTQQGCPPRWACCTTAQRPEPSCYDPLMPQPC
jgi:hypothetical protein